MRYEIVEGERAFLALEPDYRSLYASVRADDPFNSPEWIYTWYAHHRDLGTPCVILIYASESRQLLCAYALFRIASPPSSVQTQRVMPMAYDSADYLEPLIATSDQAIAQPLASAIKKLLGDHRCTLRVPEMPTVAAQALCDALAGRDIHYVDKRASQCPYVPLEGTFKEFIETRFNAKARQTFRRKLRRLNDHGAVSIKSAHTGDELETMLPVIADIETQSWKGDQDVGLFASARSKTFYIEALKKLTLAGRARVTTLMLADKPIAY